MNPDFKPLLAVPIKDFDKLKFPVFASPKLDGIRCIIIDGRPQSRHLKTIPNKYVQAQLAGLPDGLDGELMLDVPGKFSNVSSAIMSRDGEPDFTLWVFDIVGDEPYIDRLKRLEALPAHPRVQVLTQKMCLNIDDLSAFEAQCVEHGFEGAMVRSLGGEYKFGRSTEKQGILLKWKRFCDTEAIIIGVKELMHNDNTLTTDLLGHAKRSHAKAGLRPAGVLGALVCRHPIFGEFDLGTGFTDTMRDLYWAGRASLPGQLAKFKYQPDPAWVAGDGPRFPTFLGLRHKDDL